MMKKITFKAILFGAVVLLGMTNTMKAATITVSSDAVVAGVNYNTIQAAYDYVKALPTLTEKYVIELQSSYDPTTGITLETFPITLAANTASADFDITIKPATGVKKTLAALNKTVIATGMDFAINATTLDLTGKITVGDISMITATSYIAGMGTYIAGTFKQVASVSGNVLTIPSTALIAARTGVNLYFGTAQTKTISFNGAKYVTIDGVSRDALSTTGLTIENPNCIYAQTIYFTGNSQYNTIKNCIVRGANQTGAWNNGWQGTIFFQAGTSNTCSYNIIDNNDVCDMNNSLIPYPICAIQMTAAGGTNTNQTVSNNNIYNISNKFSGNGTCIFIQFGSESTSSNNSVLNNRLYWTAPTTFSNAAITFTGFGTIGLGNRIENNVFGYGASNGTGKSTLTFTGSGTIYAMNGIKNSTCKNNTVGGIDITGTNFVGIGLAAHTAGSLTDINDICIGNQIKDINIKGAANGTLYGIFYPSAPSFSVNIKNNTIKNLTNSSETATVISTILGVATSFGSSGTIAINSIGNEISNLTAGKTGSSAANAVTAFQSGGCNVVFEKNLIYNLKTITSSTTSVIKGIRLAVSFADGKIIKNNIIRLGTDVTSDAEISAVINEGISSNAHPCNLYHNSIYIGGTSQTKPSHCLSRSGAISGAINIKNNILSNKRTGSTAVNQVYNLYALTDVTSSEYNLYQYGSLFGTVTTTSPATFPTLSDWNSERLLASPTSLSEDVNSKDQLAPLFADATAATPDMHLPANSPANETGLAIGTVTDDFAGMIRADYTTAATTNADMGALVISNSTSVESAKQLSDLSVYGSHNTIRFANLSGKSASVYSFAGQLLKSFKLTSDNVSVPADKGLYIVIANGEVTKVMVK